jgi:hypothetical protein
MSNKKHIFTIAQTWERLLSYSGRALNLSILLLPLYRCFCCSYTLLIFDPLSRRIVGNADRCMLKLIVEWSGPNAGFHDGVFTMDCLVDWLAMEPPSGL